MAFFEGIGKWFADLGNLFYKDFIKDASWKLLLQGLGNTMLISLFAVLIGLLLGVVIAIVRSTYDKNREVWALQKGVKYYVFMILNALCRVYITVIRGVPVVVQLVLMYLIILVNVPSALLVAIIACSPIVPALGKLLLPAHREKPWSAARQTLCGILFAILPVALILLSLIFLVGNTYNPFLYFQF